MDNVFVDTDVVLDLFIRREPHHTEALQLFTHTKRSKAKCFTSPIVIANAYYILAKVKNKQYALERIKGLRKFVKIVPVDEMAIDAALAKPYKDFEDSIQYSCAKRNGIGTIVTRNTKDYPKSDVTIANPGEYLNASKPRERG
jgi:predicted nucleic acid-binding protein